MTLPANYTHRQYHVLKEFVSSEILQYCNDNGLTSSSLGRLLKVGQSRAHRLMHGVTMPSFTTLISIHNNCKGFDVVKLLEGKKQ